MANVNEGSNTEEETHQLEKNESNPFFAFINCFTGQMKGSCNTVATAGIVRRAVLLLDLMWWTQLKQDSSGKTDIIGLSAPVVPTHTPTSKEQVTVEVLRGSGTVTNNKYTKQTPWFDQLLHIYKGQLLQIAQVK